MNRTGLDSNGLNWCGEERAGAEWPGLDWTGLDWLRVRLATRRTGLGWAWQHFAIHYRTRTASSVPGNISWVEETTELCVLLGPRQRPAKILEKLGARAAGCPRGCTA